MTEMEDPFGAPLRHLQRMAPPWADQHRTVCGRPLSDVASVVSWDEAKSLVTKHGRKRAMFLFCQTCLSQERVAERDTSWEANPVAVTADYASRARWSKDDPARAELLALAELVAAHPDEYAEAVARRLVPDVLAERRTAKRKGARG